MSAYGRKWTFSIGKTAGQLLPLCYQNLDWRPARLRRCRFPLHVHFLGHRHKYPTFALEGFAAVHGKYVIENQQIACLPGEQNF
jgi:hypothetical protein